MIYFIRGMCLVLSVFVLGACSGELPGDEGELRALTEEVDANQDEFEMVKKRWGSGDVSSGFIAFLDGDDVVLIEEEMTRGETGLSKNRFYFFEDVLFCYREKRMNKDNTVLEIEVLFDREGQVVVQKQLTDGKPSEMASYVVPLAKKHGKTLKDLVDKREE